MGRIIPALSQFFDGSGELLSNGWIRFLEPSSNNTDKNSYNDYLYQIVNENPLRLGGDGRCPDAFGQGSYRLVLYREDPDDETAVGEQIDVRDPVTAQAEDIGGGGGEGFQDWVSTTTYQLGDIVTYNNEYYISLTSSNLNNNPGLDTFAWENIEFLGVWNDTISYNSGALVRYQENLYFSKASLNLNNQPDVTPASWRRVDTEIVQHIVITDDSTLTTLDRDSHIILGGATIADRLVTLPVVDATNDGFRVWLFNASNFNMTIAPGAGASIWYDSTNNVVIEKGSSLEVRYCSNQNRWLPQSNVGPVLGGQDIGTSTMPINDLYGGTVTLSGNLSMASDTHLYLGDSNELDIFYNSTDTVCTIDAAQSLYFNVATGDEYTFNINDVEQWKIITTGELIPSFSNNNKDIGTEVFALDNLFTEAVNGSGHLRLGINGGDLTTEYIEIFNYVINGLNLEIYFRFDSNTYKITATP